MEEYPMAMVTAPGKIEFVQRALPPLGANDVLLRVQASSICGGDLHLYKGKHPLRLCQWLSAMRSPVR